MKRSKDAEPVLLVYDFISHYVQMKPDWPAGGEGWRMNFISHYVQMKLPNLPEVLLSPLFFISHYVQMKRGSGNNYTVTLSPLYPTTFRWNAVPWVWRDLLENLYIPLRSDETLMNAACAVKLDGFISHYVQMKPLKVCSAAGRKLALYPTTFRWNAGRPVQVFR